jgi:hypothetical protein
MLLQHVAATKSVDSALHLQGMQGECVENQHRHLCCLLTAAYAEHAGNSVYTVSPHALQLLLIQHMPSDQSRYKPTALFTYTAAVMVGPGTTPLYAM